MPAETAQIAKLALRAWSNKTKKLSLFLILKGQREALWLLRKRTVSAKVKDLAEHVSEAL